MEASVLYDKILSLYNKYNFLDTAIIWVYAFQNSIDAAIDGIFIACVSVRTIA